MVRAAGKAEVLGRIEKVRARGDKLKGDFITLAHGARDKASTQLVDQVFVAEYGNDTLGELIDAGVMNLTDLTQQAGYPLGAGEKLAFSTDSYVMNPVFFPGSLIGDLAVNGTINDLSISGAIPFGISAAFIVEEGLEIEVLRRVVADMHHAADRAGVKIETGDTKVISKGAADRLFITTAGVGIVPPEVNLGASLATDGDAITISGPVTNRGMAVMLTRGDLAIAAPIETGSQTVSHLARALLKAAPNARWMRDATRGGLATVPNELAQISGKDVAVYEEELVVHEMTQGVCDILGIDPLYIVNEGMFVSIIPELEAAAALVAIQALPGGESSAIVGKIVPQPTSIVMMVTGFKGARMVDTLVGDPLPRIC